MNFSLNTPILSHKRTWTSKIVYTEPTPFVFSNISNKECNVSGNCIKIHSPLSEIEHFSDFQQSVLEEISRNSSEWFGHQCSLENLKEAVTHTQHTNLMINAPVTIHSYDENTEDGILDIDNIQHYLSRVVDLIFEICAVQFYETNIIFELQLTHVTLKPMKDAFLEICKEDIDVVHKDIPLPSSSELENVNSIIQHKLHEKQLQIEKLNAIEEFLQSNYHEKIEKLCMNRKHISDEIASLQFNSEENL